MKKLENSHILITGGAGFIGSNLVEKFLKQNNRITVLDNFSTGKRENLAAFVGILIAGKMSDRLALINPKFRMVMQACGLLVAAPFIVMMGYASTLAIVFIGFAGFGFARAFFDANTYPVLYDVVPEKYRSSASGVMLMIGFGVGSLSPLVLGMLKQYIGLSTGISMLAIVWIVCSVVMLYTAYTRYNKDYSTARKIDTLAQ